MHGHRSLQPSSRTTEIFCERVAIDSCVVWVGAIGSDVEPAKLTCKAVLRLHFRDHLTEGFDNQPRFVLDIPIPSPIIYIWYEGVRLRQRLVNV